METDKGRLFYATGINNSQLRQDAAESRSILASIGQQAVTESDRMDAAFSKIARAAGGIFALSQLKQFATEIISVRGEIESLQISFETLAGKRKGNQLFSEIKEFAAHTPMMMGDLAKGAQTMLAFNIEAEKVMPILKAIGDISMGDSQKFNSLALAFSQMSATGKLMGQDLLQMINAGFNPLSVISEKTGKSIGELKEEMEQGKITTEMVTQAFIAATSEGGKFYGMLEKQSKGINGAISNFQGAVDDAFNEIGTKAQGATVDIVNAGTYLVKHYDTILDIVGVLLATYGTYRAALIVNIAVEKMMASANAERIAAIEAEITAVGMKTAQEQLAMDADIAAAVAKGNLTQAEGLQILALKQEAAARVEALALAAKQAAAEAAAATAARRNAGVRLQAAEANATAMRMEYQAALAKGEVFEIAVAKERMETAQTQINTASQQYQAAASAEAAAAKAAQTAQTTANTAAQQLNNIQVQAGTVQTGIFATAVGKLTAAIRALWATMMKHPIALVLAAIAALGVAIYKATNKAKELSQAEQVQASVMASATAAVAEEKTKIETLSEVVHDNTKTYKERKTALDLLQKIVPDYHAALTKEGRLINDNADALDRYINGLMKAAKLEAIKGGVTDTFKNLSSKAMDVRNKERQGYGAFLNFLTSDENLEKNKQKWDKWFADFTKDPTKFVKKIDGKTMVKIGDFYMHSGMGDDWITEDQRQLIEYAEKYVQYQKMYKEIIKEDVTNTSSTPSGNKNKSRQSEVRAKRADLAKTATQSGETASDNKDMLASEALQRMKQEQEYARKLADQAKDNEFEIRQARIDAMKDGVEKELAQNQLNYDRLEEQNNRRLRDMLDGVAEARLRALEDANPTMFKKKNKDGKLEDDPGKRDKKLNEIRAGLTAEDLPEPLKKQYRELAKIANDIFTRANTESLQKMLADVMTYEQQRLKITEDYARKRAALYEHNGDGSIKTDASGNKVLKQGVEQGNIDEINRQEQEALNGIDEQFAKREESYQAWCDAIANLSLRQLNAVLQQAKDNLAELKKSSAPDPKKLAVARAKVNKAQAAVNKANANNNTAPGKRTLKEWEDLYKTLQDVGKEFENIGDTVGGVVGDIISQCGQFATSTLQMINGIVQLTHMSATSIQGTAAAGATAISTMEKASVILTIISAALQIAMQIVNLFNNDDKKQKEIEKLQDRIDQLQWELDHAEIGRTTAAYGSAIERVNKALQESRAELVAGQHGWMRIITLCSRASKNQELMAKTAEKLANAYANMAYTADKALGAKKYEEANDQLKNIAQQQILIQEQIDQEYSKKKTDHGQIQEWKNKIEELGQQALEIINDMVEDIIGDSAEGIAEELGDAFIEAFQSGEDAAEAWGDKVKEIVSDVLKRMLVSKFLEEPLGDIFDKYKSKWFPNGQFAGLDAVIASMNGFASDLNAVGKDFAEIWNNLPDSVKNMFEVTDEAEREASQKGIATADQDSIDELNGRMTAVQSHTFSISEYTKQLLTTAQALLRSLLHIEEETDGLHDRMERVENYTKSIHDSVDDIVTKGIKLK